MKKIKETFLKKYAVWEYVAFAGGLVLFGNAIKQIVLGQYTDISTVAAIALSGLVLMASPVLYIKLFKQNTGLDQ